METYHDTLCSYIRRMNISETSILSKGIPDPMLFPSKSQQRFTEIYFKNPKIHMEQQKILG